MNGSENMSPEPSRHSRQRNFHTGKGQENARQPEAAQKAYDRQREWDDLNWVSAHGYWFIIFGFMNENSFGFL